MSEESYICKQAVELFGAEMQTSIFHEECGELMQAISKHKRGCVTDTNNIAEEIAHVEICLEQLKHIYRCHARVNQEKAKKLTKLCYAVEKVERKIGRDKY